MENDFGFENYQPVANQTTWTQYTLHSIADVVLHIIFVGTFVIIFFFLYASFIERTVVQTETTEIVQDLQSQISAMLSDDENKQVRVQMQTLQYPDMSEADGSVQSTNDNLLIESLIFLGILVNCGLILICILWYFGRFSLGHLFLHNFVAVTSVAVTDFTFLTLFARSYKPSDASVVKKTLLTSLENWTKTAPIA